MGSGRYRGVVREEPPSEPPAKDAVTITHSGAHGRTRVTLPWVLLALLLGLTGGGVAAERMRPQDTATQTAAYAELAHKLDAAETQAQAREQAQAVVNAALLNRTAALETSIGELRATNVALLAAIRSR